MIQMLQQIRIEAAKEMLESTIFTVDEIASRVGYSDLKHFIIFFTGWLDARRGNIVPCFKNRNAQSLNRFAQ